MKKILALILTISLLAAFALVFTSCDNDEKSYMAPPTINGVALADYALVYDEDGLDYNKRAVEYIKNLSHDRYGVELEVIDDSAEKRSHEIVVGETSRDISVSLDEDTQGFEFSILASDGSIALEGDYFVIAAAAYYFMETYALTDAQISTVPELASVHQPIVKEAKNFILLIGDGMGVYQTRLFEYLENNCEYSDGESLFYGYMFPYMVLFGNYRQCGRRYCSCVRLQNTQQLRWSKHCWRGCKIFNGACPRIW